MVQVSIQHTIIVFMIDITCQTHSILNAKCVSCIIKQKKRIIENITVGKLCNFEKIELSEEDS
jgi:hypothetical protein